MRLFTIPLLTAFSFIFAPGAYARLYACGGFNGWNALNPAEFAFSEGLYTLDIDFSVSDELKISTVKGETGNGWGEFDTGTLYPETAVLAGRWVPLKAQDKSANIVAPAKTEMTVTVDLDRMLIKFGDGTEAPASWSGTLPVLFINTAGGKPVTEKEKYLDATYYLDPMGLPGVEAVGSSHEPLATQIKGRGNYTWSGFEKKPYRLKFAEKASVLGMPASRHFVLLAHADDSDGFLRNESGFTLSRLLGMPWTPESEPVELVMNGEYMGLYFLTQNIRVSKDRVDIVEQEDLATADVDGGWLVEIDNYDSDPHVTVFENGNADAPIWFTYKSPEALSTEQETYLQSQMQAIDDAVYSPDNTGTDTPLSRLVDFDVLARYYITQEVVDDSESFHGSCYLNRDRGEERKWKFGPVWDFGNAFNRRASDRFIWQDPAFHEVWIGTIYRFPAFRRKVEELWAWYLGFGPEALKSRLSSFVDKVEVAALYDARRWPAYGNADIREDLKTVTELIDPKTEWLRRQWGSQSGIQGSRDASGTLTDVYDLQGTKVLSGASEVDMRKLPAGLYITPRGKFLVR